MFKRKIRIKSSKRKLKLFRRDYKSVGPVMSTFEGFVFVILIFMLCFVIYNIVLAIRMV